MTKLLVQKLLASVLTYMWGYQIYSIANVKTWAKFRNQHFSINLASDLSIGGMEPKKVYRRRIEWK